MIWFRYILNVLAIISLIVLLSFTQRKQEVLPCKEVKISIIDEASSFITKREILQIINSIVDSVEGLPIHKISLYEIEQTICNHPHIQSADVFLLPNAELQVHVSQKKPIVRVFNLSGESFYIDPSANTFPLSKNFTERVLIANGNIVDSSDVSVISKVANYINDDEFLKAQIIQLHMNEDKEIELVPRVGNHTILLGEISEMEDKFNKLKLFYAKGVKQTGWNQYRLINLKYKNQLVCVKQ